MKNNTGRAIWKFIELFFLVLCLLILFAGVFSAFADITDQSFFTPEKAKTLIATLVIFAFGFLLWLLLARS